MEKSIKHSWKGMIQDISSSKFPNEYYFEGKNIRIVATDSQSTGSVSNEKGNKFILEIPSIQVDELNKKINYNDKQISYNTNEINSSLSSSTHQIIGRCFCREFIILISTDSKGSDAIWKLSYDHELSLIYLRNMNLNISNPVDVINNYENRIIDKIYWTDGINQLSLININHSIENGDSEELIDVPLSSVRMVGEYNLSSPRLTNIVFGGSHTSGMIQYAYNLYRVNSSQTKMSPFSELISLDKGNGNGGGDVNEKVGSIPVLKIENIDLNYTNIRVYAIKYTSFNQVPSVFLISDSQIPKNGNFDIFDDGSFIETISLEEFIFLGSDIIIPQHLASKDNRLILANYKEKNFNVDLDLRAYSFNNLGVSKVYNNIFFNGTFIDGEERIINFNFTDDYNDNFDSINLDYDIYKYQLNGFRIGGEGKYLKYELTQSSELNDENRYFKDSEIYRLGIQFYNKYGQITAPYWISDFKSREGNLEGMFNTLKFELKPDFYVWLNDSSNFTNKEKPVGYKLLIAERTLNDKTIVANGILSTMMCNIKSSQEVFTEQEVLDFGNSLPKIPNILLRNCNSNSIYGSVRPLQGCNNLNFMSGSFGPDTEVQVAYYGDKDASGKFFQYNTMLQMYSPEILFNNPLNLNQGLKLRIKGGLLNKYNAVWSKETNLDGGNPIESKSYNGISPHFASANENITGNAFSNLDNGLIAHPGGSDPNRVEYNLWYRGYGDVEITDSFTSSKLIKISNPFTVINGSDPDNEYIKQMFGGNFIETRQDSQYLKVDCVYTINIDPLYSSVPYKVKICADQQGNNVWSQTSLITGNTTLSYSDTFFPTSISTFREKNFYLIIETDFNISGSVDVNFVLENGTSPDLEKESLLNLFLISGQNSSFPFFQKSLSNTEIDIYGTPEFTERGQDFKTYNNDSNYKYTNSLVSCMTDGNSEYDDKGAYGRRIISINSENNRCITFVTGPNDSSVEHQDRPSLENLFEQTNIFGNDYSLIGELVKSREEIYLGNIYGGNSFEEKLRTNYIEIGDYNDINLNVVDIKSPGDTFVNYFKFLRVVRNEQNIVDQGYKQYEEIVEFLTETTVDLKNRNDISLQYWDNKIYYSNDEYHRYNQVYSQMPDLIKRRNLEYTFKKNEDFDTDIITTKAKSPGEIIDNWTDILQNENLSLDGRYGPINAIINFNDEIYTFQDNAFAFISVNPRIQVQGSDGLQIELGKGSVLADYKYISETGCLNKWGIVESPSAIYFYDLIKNTLNSFSGSISGLSDMNQMHSYFIKNVNRNDIIINNPLIGKGISAGYDYINNEALFTFHQENNSFTISYNEITKNFVSFYDYKPSMYISYGSDYIVLDKDAKKLYEQFKGEYNMFFDQYYPSRVTINVNPEPNLDCVFNNINFKSECYLNGVDQPLITINKIKAYNDYQSSPETPLVYSRSGNLRRKFRDWNAYIPRSSRNRIRNPWIKLELIFENTQNYKLILHDVYVYYNI